MIDEQIQSGGGCLTEVFEKKRRGKKRKLFMVMMTCLIKFWGTSNNTIFNTTFVVTTEDFEESFITPIFIP